MARFDEMNAQEGVRVARDPFSPKLVMGSGLAYTNGFPMSIEGSAPSLFQVKAIQSLYNRPQSFLVAKAKVEAQSAGHAISMRREEALDRTMKLYLDADRAARNLTVVRGQIVSLEAVSASVAARLEEGRALPIETRRAELNARKSQQRASILTSEVEQVQRQLAFVLGYESDDIVETVATEGLAIPAPPVESEAVREALDSSKELKKLLSDLQAKGLEVQANKTAWYPQIDLVAQYGLFARFNNYDDFFNRFSRNNALLGASFKFPVIPGTAASAGAAKATNDISRLRLQIANTRHRIELDTRKLYADLALHQENKDVAKLDLDVARDQVEVVLAQIDEGRAGRRQLEEARFLEAEKWLAYYDAQYLYDRAKVSILTVTGALANLELSQR